MMDHSWSWGAIVLLGAWHGINPGMGWLFAVALGLQEGRGTAVWRALPPLALGHGLAIAAVLLLAALVGLVLPPLVLKWLVVVALLGFGVYRLVSHRHPRYGGMRVGFRDLTIWSFLMASAHGAGLMVLPFVLGLKLSAHGSGGHGAHMAHMAGIGDPTLDLMVTLVHSVTYLCVTALVAWVVYDRLGLRLLRQAWFNVDLVWVVALMVTGGLTALVQ
jgi:hypothetical protein